MRLRRGHDAHDGLLEELALHPGRDLEGDCLVIAGHHGGNETCGGDHLDPRPGTWQARHDCGRDEYLLAGRRLDDATIEERWRVRGPDKDYEITTTLVRA